MYPNVLFHDMYSDTIIYCCSRVLSNAAVCVCDLKDDAILEPEAELMERHGLLVAHSCDQEKIMIQLLYPSPAPMTVRKNEKVGTLNPLAKQSESVCIVGRPHEWSQPEQVDWEASAIQQLLSEVESVDNKNKEKLESLMKEFEDVISR